MALGTVLMVAAVAAVAAFAMAALCTTSLNFAQHYAGLRDAQYLAESAIVRAIYQVHDDSTYGTNGDTKVVVQPDPGDDRRMAIVTFDTTAGLPYSTNNIDGNDSDSYGMVQLPTGSVRLIATGKARGVAATVDVVLTKPEFPYVVACSGPFQSTGTLVVKGAASMDDFVAQEQNASKPTPASMGCNNSISSTEAATITGDVVATGSVSLPDGSRVGGEIRKGTIELPYIDPTPHDPSGVPGANRQGPVTGPLPGLTGQNFSVGDLTVNGDLTLSGGLLYVKGNLIINGGLQGSGAVMVTGTTTINGGADLAATNLVALLSEGSITINGNPGAKKYLQGLVYTQGSLSASNITLAGTLVAGGSQGVALGTAPLGSGGGMTLTNVSAVYVPQVAALKMTIGGTAADPQLIQHSTFNGMGGGTTSMATAPEYAPWNFSGPASVPSSISAAMLANTTPDTSVTGYNTVWLEPPGGAPYAVGYNMMSGQPNQVGPMSLGVVQLLDPGNHAKSLLQVYVSALKWVGGKYVLTDPPTVTYIPTDPGTGSYTNLKEGTGSYLATMTLTHDQAEHIAQQHGTTVEAMAAFATERQRRFAAAANHALGLAGSGSGGTAIDLTLNQFLRDTTPFRIVSWKLW